MDVLQMLHRVASPPCADCLYRLGVVRCVVCPCPACRMTGFVRPFAARASLATARAGVTTAQKSAESA